VALAAAGYQAPLADVVRAKDYLNPIEASSPAECRYSPAATPAA
jgi:hypothetical protein